MSLPDLETQAQQTADGASELQRLRSLVEASGTLLASLHVEDVLPRVLDLARQTLAADAYALWRVDSTGAWEIARQHGLSPEYAATAPNAVSGTGSIVALDAPLVAEDLDAAEWLTPAHRAAHEREGTRSLLAVGLQDRDRVLGTIAFYYREPHRFTEEERTTAVALAGLAAASLVTAQLYEAEARMAGTEEAQPVIGDLGLVSEGPAAGQKPQQRPTTELDRDQREDGHDRQELRRLHPATSSPADQGIATAPPGMTLWL